MDLVRVLTNMEDPNIFLTNKRTSQKMLLEGTLGEGHELVDRILDSISPDKVHHKHSNAFTHQRTTFCLAHDCIVTVHRTLPPHTPPQPLTLGSRIEEYLLAPSKVKETEVVKVACYIFGEDFASPSEIKEFVAQHIQSEAVESQHSATEDQFFQVLTDTFTWTHNVSEEEPPGYLPLGILVVFFGKMLSRTLNNTYKCHPQRIVARNDNPGQNPSTDVAIILRMKTDGDDARYISKVLYKYKPYVSNLLNFVDIKHLMELFLQCYYTLKFENQSKILGCLTDLHCWHYIGLRRNNSKLKVTFYSKLNMSLPPKQIEMADHFSFLMNFCKC